jgi:teichuronic acid exporter
MVAKNIFWDLLGKVSYQGIGFVVSIFLARILLPEDFGLIAMVMAFVGVANIFTDMGFGAAIIQRNEINEIHLSSVFWINLFVAILMSSICFFCAPIVGVFYKNTEIIKLTQALSFTFVFSAVSSIHRSILVRKLAFKYQAKAGVISALVSGVIGVYFAYSGLGVWSLVIQNYISLILGAILLWFGTKWLPTMSFSWGAIKPLWSYSNKLFFSSLLEAIYSRIDVFIIGKIFTPSTLGYYSRGVTLNQLIANYSSGSLNAVLFPTLSKLQNNIELVKENIIKFYHTTAFISFFLGGLLFLISENLIVLLFTEKWIETSKYFEILVLSSFVYPLSAVILTPLRSLGFSNLFLKLEVIKKILLTLVIIIGFNYGIFGYLYALTIFYYLSLFINGYFTGKKINWPVLIQVKEILFYFFVTSIAVSAIYFVRNYLDYDTHLLNLLVTSICFLIVYVLLCALLNIKGFVFIKNYVFTFLKNKP